MAISKAKRRRQHVLRNLGKDVTTQRGEVAFSTHTRTTKTKKDKLQVQFHKHKKHFQGDHYSDGDAFLVVSNIIYFS
ncbi:hypothetical protein ABE042_02190 [Viridibacillus arvi]|uniref:Uncharacterized protein n=1 Tax=Viridibacillus arvi TaxID=263475 RepID=A0A0M0LK74_9BACL|nr:hypothetical protein [Viridibacillus arvi]KOO51312.1 hypothetical protein AMD00_02115 [Viridibacillus arvi]